jgi:hypothetical protein
LEEKKKKKGSETSTSGINVIEINIALSSSESWVFDTGSMIHTCKSLQGLSETRRFARGELDVRVGNGAKVAALAVGTYHLSLPSRIVLELNNCYCIPALRKTLFPLHVWNKLMVLDCNREQTLFYFLQWNFLCSLSIGEWIICS